MPTSLRIGSAAQTIQLLGQPSLIIGSEPTSVHLRSPDGTWDLKVPRSAFGNMLAEPGEPMIVSLTLTKVRLVDEPALPDAATLIGKAN